MSGARRRLVAASAATSLAAAALVLAAVPAAACSCARQDPASVYRSATAVVTGRVLGRDLSGIGGSSADPVVLTVAVDRVLRGTAPRTLRVVTAASDPTCGLRLPARTRSLLVLQRYGASRSTFSAGGCGTSRVLSSAVERRAVAVLGSGHAPLADAVTEPPAARPVVAERPASAFSGTRWLAAVAVVAAVMAVAALLRRRRGVVR